MRIQKFVILTVAVAAPACNAVASTIDVSGTLPGDQTWTPTETYQLIGDVNISAMNTLSVDPGTTILASPFDETGSGLSPAKVEFTVQGALNLYSTGSNIQLSPDAGQSTNSWYGVVVPGGGVVNLAGGSTQLNGGLQLQSASTLSITGNSGPLVVNGNVTLGGSLQLKSNPLLTAVGTKIKVLDLSNAGTVTGAFSGLPEGGTFKLGNVTWEATYDAGKSVTLRAIDVTIPVPPPPVGGGGGTGGGGGGACDTGSSTTLSGGLITGTTILSCSGSPYRLTADLTVPAGQTLTMDPGVSVLPSATDASGSGNDTSKVELDVKGTLAFGSTPGAPSAIGPADNGIDGWSGVTIGTGGIFEDVDGGLIEGSLQFADHSMFSDSVSGLADYQPLSIGGDLHLDGKLALAFGSNYHPALGDTLKLFDVANNRLVVGMFDGLPEGTELDFPDFSFELTYKGGDGNDVELDVIKAATDIPEPATILLFGPALFGLGFARRYVAVKAERPALNVDRH